LFFNAQACTAQLFWHPAVGSLLAQEQLRVGTILPQEMEEQAALGVIGRSWKR